MNKCFLTYREFDIYEMIMEILNTLKLCKFHLYLNNYNIDMLKYYYILEYFMLFYFIKYVKYFYIQ